MRLILKLIVRPNFPEVREIELEGKVDGYPYDFPGDTLAKLVFDVEQAINNHLPQIRAHFDIRDDK